tara:strand:+ start:5437 stop:5856 length:420 start_codon:yes stop_codon:yes gene_type:complete
MSDDIVKTLLESLTDEQKAQLVQGLLKSNENEEVPVLKEEAVSSKPRSNVTEDFKVVKNDKLEKRKTPVKARKNQWVDEGEDRDPDFDPAKFERMGRASRNRGKVKKRTVECHVCGRDFQVNPALVHGEYFRCNRCTGR